MGIYAPFVKKICPWQLLTMSKAERKTISLVYARYAKMKFSERWMDEQHDLYFDFVCELVHIPMSERNCL